MTSERDRETGMEFARELRGDRTLVARVDAPNRGETWYLRAKSGNRCAFDRAIVHENRERHVRLTDLGTSSIVTLCAHNDVVFADIDECRGYFESPDYDARGCAYPPRGSPDDDSEDGLEVTKS